jgi:hypothetical protein
MGGASSIRMASLSDQTLAFAVLLEALQYTLPLRMTCGVIGEEV